jgi:hypothetical protein
MFVVAVGLAIVALLLVWLMFSPVVQLPSRSARIDLITNGGAGEPIVLAATTGVSVTMTAVADLTGVAIGALVSGPDVLPGTIVKGMDNAAHTVTLSAAATGINTGNYTFTNPGGLFRTQGANFNLFQTDINPAVGDTLAAYTPNVATFNGYAPKVLTMSLGYIDVTSTPYAQSQLLSFIATDASMPNTIYGWWIDDGTNIIMAAKFNAPVAMALAGQEISGVFADGYPTGTGWQALIPNNL